MTKAETAMANLHAQHSVSEDEAKQRKARERAAREWVAHYMAVDKLLVELVEMGEDPTTFTDARIEELLVESWEIKADEKNNSTANRMAERFGCAVKAA